MEPGDAVLGRVAKRQRTRGGRPNEQRETHTVRVTEIKEVIDVGEVKFART
jgi:hypothetical protein